MDTMQLNAYGVQELDARAAAGTDGGVLPVWIVPAAIAAYVAKDIYDNAEKFVGGVVDGWNAAT